jgi:hypothetical protein
MNQTKKSQKSLQIQNGKDEKELSYESFSRRVDFCCCSLRNESFYLFINMLDLVLVTFVSMLIGYMNVGQTSSNVLGYLKIALGTLNILLFAFASAGFMVFLVKLQFNTTVHKIYSAVRLVVCGLR